MTDSSDLGRIGRVRRRIGAERWVIDALRRQPVVRRLRQLVERVRTRRLTATAGSVDAALAEIVREALRQ